MALINITYDEEYFNSTDPNTAGYTHYCETTYYKENFELFTNRLVQKLSNLNLTNKKVLVVGCAYGFVVKYLVSLGVNAFGFDISEYAISQADPSIASRVFVGDARTETAFQTAKTMAGLTKPNDKFDLIVDEDMLSCLTDSEASAFCTLARSYSSYFVHIYSEFSNLDNYYNYKTVSAWKALVDNRNRDRWFTRLKWEDK